MDQGRDLRIREAVDCVKQEIYQSRPSVQASKLASNLDRVSNSLRKFGNQRNSPIISILGHVGNYWRSGILSLLMPMPLRPSAIMKQLAAVVPDHPISHRILTLNLRALERDGLIRRYTVEDARAHVEYELTDLGKEVCELMWGLIDWGEKNFEHIMLAREKFNCSN